MSGRFVRASKYRHVFGRPTRKEQCYDNLRISKNAWDTNLVKANPEYLSVNWEASGGGAFAVIPLQERGKLPDQIPLFRGHTAAVLDTDWSPFDDSFLASGSDDGKVLLWKVPKDFTLHQEAEEMEDVKPVLKLAGHSRKVGHVLFNPNAKDVLASSSGDYTIKLWDVEDGSSKLTLKHGDIVQSLSWSANGSLLVSTCRDKKLRVWDVRQEKPAVETPGHSGAKNSRAVWMGELDRVATTGFSKMSDRQLGLWDVRAAREPLNGFEILDQISGICMPFWDDGTQCLYLAGKGDGNIRYYEYENDRFQPLSQYSSTEPQRGIAFIPKRGVNTHENEVMRAYKTVNDAYIEPISFIVPRKAESFQGDIYPPAVGLRPGMTSKEWHAGKDAMAPKFSLESLYDNEPPKEVPSDYKPAAPLTSATTASAPTSVAANAAETQSKSVSAQAAGGGASVVTSKQQPDSSPAPATAARAAPPTASMKHNQSSIASAASKFADNESEDEDGSSSEETSSFEEIQKPTRRTAAVAPTTSEPSSLKSTTAPSNSASASVFPSNTPVVTASEKETATLTSPSSPPSSSAAVANAAASNLRTHLQEIKEMLELQNKTIAAQNDKIDVLTKEIEILRTKSSAGWR